MKRMCILLLGAAAFTACANTSSGQSEARWTSRGDAQPFSTAVAACQQISAGNAANFTLCMAGRGWIRRQD